MEKIKTRRQLKEYLDCELSRYPRGKHWYNRIILISEYQVLAEFHVLLRKSEYYYNTHNKLMSEIFLFRLKLFENKYCMRVPINCCGKGLRFFHQGPVIINPDAEIGENVSFHFNTAVVNKTTGGGAPIIGNNVMIGIGAVVMGNITVADNVVIGANALVNRSILTENVSVAGVPAKIL